MSSQDSAYHTQSQGASTPTSEILDSGINEGSFDNSIKMNSSTLNGYNSMPNHKIKSDEQIIPKKDSSVKISEHKHSNSSSHHNSDHIKKKDGDLHKHSSSSKHKDEINKVKSSNSISTKEHDKKHDHSRGDSEKLKKDKSSSEKSHHDSSKKVDKHHDDKHRDKPKDGHSSSGHSEHKHKEHKSKDGEHKSKERDKSKESSKEHDKSKHESSKDKLKKIESHKEKHAEKPKEKIDKVKDKSDKPKEKSDKPKEKSDKPKEKLDKPKDKTDKPKEKIDDKHKERSEDKHKEKSEHKHKESGDKSKDKLEKLKEKSDKPREKSDKDKHKEKSDKPKEKSDRPKEKSDKPKEKLDKPKEKILDKSKDKSISEKRTSSPEKKPQIKEHSKKDATLKLKVEMSITTETIDNSLVKLESDAFSPRVKEEYSSEDDVPLSARKVVKEEKPVTIKRELDESDEEPLSAKVTKLKKIKAEPSSAKKRKAMSDEDDYGEDDDYADDDYDSDYAKPSKKKSKKETKPKKTPAKTSTKTKIKSEPSTSTASPTKKGRVKKEETEDVWKWWEEEKHEGGTKWRTLEHKGPVFAPAYERVPKNVKFYYDGKHMPLSEVTEEVAGFYGRMLDHDYTTKDSFNTNFFKDWKKVMTAEEKEKIKDLKKCNFNDFNAYYKMKSEERKAMTKEEKQEIKKQNEALTQEYGYCVIDGHRQKIGNFKIEPPGLFRGRGEHPKMGMLKRRVQPEDILINIGKEAKVPEAPAGHKWKEVRHDNTVTWLCSWTENILGSTKYIMLNPSSKLKGEKDWQKYETARKLKNHADRIRKTYTEDFKSKEMKIRQRAVALYFIDKLALRAGNEKDEDTADTVGCCSLRVEHITLDEEKDGQQYVVSFDFLGKDSIRYFNSVPVEKRAYKNLKLFMENKQPGDDLFDRLNTSILNKYLTELMDGLTAKVFRTYNASKTLQEQLDLLTKEEMSIPEKLLAYNRANRAVAILCNHQRAVPKTFDKSMENLKTKIDDKIQQIRACKKDIKQLKSDKSSANKVLAEKKKKRLNQLEDQLKKLEVQATDKEENKQIALGTSKLNYLDPRISVAWCKKWDIPIEKIYNRTQRDKFRWAIEMAGPEYKF